MDESLHMPMEGNVYGIECLDSRSCRKEYERGYHSFQYAVVSTPSSTICNQVLFRFKRSRHVYS